MMIVGAWKVGVINRPVIAHKAFLIHRWIPLGVEPFIPATHRLWRKNAAVEKLWVKYPIGRMESGR